MVERVTPIPKTSEWARYHLSTQEYVALAVLGITCPLLLVPCLLYAGYCYWMKKEVRRLYDKSDSSPSLAQGITAPSVSQTSTTVQIRGKRGGVSLKYPKNTHPILTDSGIHFPDPSQAPSMITSKGETISITGIFKDTDPHQKMGLSQKAIQVTGRFQGRPGLGFSQIVFLN